MAAIDIREPSGEAYYAALVRHGGTEYGGVGKPRVPVPAQVYEAALAWHRQCYELRAVPTGEKSR